MAIPSDLALSKDSLVLVSGASGYIGSHVVDQLLSAGYRVRGTIRASKPWLEQLFEERHGKGRFETAIVPAVEADGAFDGVMDNVAGVVHVASDVSGRVDPSAVIPVAVNGVRNALKAASKQTSVKRFVLTSSSCAALVPKPNTKLVIDQGSWNFDSVQEAWNPETRNGGAVYAASKAQGEYAAWEWVKTNNPGFVFNAVLPNYNMGPFLHPEVTKSTMGWTRNLLKGEAMAIGIDPQYAVDVVDDARLHVAALLDPSIQNERIFAFGHAFNWAKVVGILRELRPNNTGIPEPRKDEGEDITDIKPRARAEDILKKFFGQDGWTPLEQSIAQGIEGQE